MVKPAAGGPGGRARPPPRWHRRKPGRGDERGSPKTESPRARWGPGRPRTQAESRTAPGAGRSPRHPPPGSSSAAGSGLGPPAAAPPRSRPPVQWPRLRGARGGGGAGGCGWLPPACPDRRGQSSAALGAASRPRLGAGVGGRRGGAVLLGFSAQRPRPTLQKKRKKKKRERAEDQAGGGSAGRLASLPGSSRSSVPGTCRLSPAEAHSGGGESRLGPPLPGEPPPREGGRRVRPPQLGVWAREGAAAATAVCLSGSSPVQLKFKLLKRRLQRPPLGQDGAEMAAPGMLGGAAAPPLPPPPPTKRPPQPQPPPVLPPPPPLRDAPASLRHRPAPSGFLQFRVEAGGEG